MADEFIRIDDEAVRLVINELEANLSTDALMLEIGEYIRFKIQSRTAEGKDYKGNDFIPYSPSYKLFRIKHGHPVNIVNLFFYGTMMSSMTITSSKNEAQLYFLNTQGPKDKARSPEKAFYLNKKREFFAISQDDVEGIKNIMEKYYRDLMKKLT